MHSAFYSNNNIPVMASVISKPDVLANSDRTRRYHQAFIHSVPK